TYLVPCLVNFAEDNTAPKPCILQWVPFSPPCNQVPSRRSQKDEPPCPNEMSASRTSSNRPFAARILFPSASCVVTCSVQPRSCRWQTAYPSRACQLRTC